MTPPTPSRFVTPIPGQFSFPSGDGKSFQTYTLRGEHSLPLDLATGRKASEIEIEFTNVNPPNTKVVLNLQDIRHSAPSNPAYQAVLDAVMKLKENPDMPTVGKKSTDTPWDLVSFALEFRSPRILLYGPPGTGKTKTPFLYAAHQGWHCLTTTLTEDTPMTELRGHFVLKGNEFVWHDGLIARAWRLSIEKPVLVILNEIDHASGDTSTFLHNALDDPEMAQMDMPNDETLRPMADRVMYVATMNGSPEDLSFALRDRFPVKINLTEPNPEAIKGLPKQLQLMGGNLGSHPGLTLRGLYEYGRLASVSKNRDAAARVIFGDAAPDFLNALKLAETPRTTT